MKKTDNKDNKMTEMSDSSDDETDVVRQKELKYIRKALTLKEEDCVEGWIDLDLIEGRYRPEDSFFKDTSGNYGGEEASRQEIADISGSLEVSWANESSNAEPESWLNRSEGGFRAQGRPMESSGEEPDSWLDLNEGGFRALDDRASMLKAEFCMIEMSDSSDDETDVVRQKELKYIRKALTLKEEDCVEGWIDLDLIEGRYRPEDSFFKDTSGNYGGEEASRQEIADISGSLEVSWANESSNAEPESWLNRSEGGFRAQGRPMESSGEEPESWLDLNEGGFNPLDDRASWLDAEFCII